MLLHTIHVYKGMQSFQVDTPVPILSMRKWKLKEVKGHTYSMHDSQEQSSVVEVCVASPVPLYLQGACPSEMTQLLAIP